MVFVDEFDESAPCVNDSAVWLVALVVEYFGGGVDVGAWVWCVEGAEGLFGCDGAAGVGDEFV